MRKVFMLGLALCLGVAMTIGFTGSVFAQGGPRGAINGTVTDPNGAAVPGAQVDIVNQTTGVSERTVKTNNDGSFTATLLPVGTYRLVVTASGFSKAEAPDIRVNVTETTSVSVPLKIGGVAESVTITAAAAPVQLNTATTGQTLGAESVTRLPLATGNFLTLLTLSTGANTELFQSDALGRGAVTINVNGQRPVNNNYQLEGINANDINLPQLDNVPLPNPNTVAEFKTQTSLYDASQGRNGGGNIQVALRSGSNAFHGNLYEFFRNNVLNANDFFNNRNGTARPVLRQNQFGGSVGGPIYLPRFGEGGKSYISEKNRWFFFFNYQGTRAASGAAAGTNFTTNITTLPANRSEANLIATFFPGNPDPAHFIAPGLPPGFTHLDPVALHLLTLPGNKCPGFGGDFCIPSLSGTPGITFSPVTGNPSVRRVQINRTGIGTFSDNQFTVSIDGQLTKNNKISGRYFQSDNKTFQPFGNAATLPFAKDLPGFNKFVKIGLNSVLTPRLVNDLRLGFNRFFFSQVPAEPISLADIGATRGNSSEFPGAYEFIISNAFSINGGVNDNRGGTFNTYVVGDDVSYTFGKHQIRAGFERSQYQLNRFNNFAARGSVSFGNTVAGQGGAGIPALAGFQNFLLGRVTTTQGRSGFSTFYFRAADYGAYVQDDWKLTPRLTLNLGLRWEGLSTAHEKFNFLSNFAGLGDGLPPPLKFIHPAATARVGTPGVSDCTLLSCFDKNNFAPRVGFAWNVFGDQKTVLRGGAGIYYQRVSNQPLLQTSGGSPFAEDFSASAFSVTPTNPFPNIRPASDFPLSTDIVVPRLISFNGSTGAPIFDSASGAPLGGFRFFPVRNFHAPQAYQWNLTGQREIAKDWVVDVGYVGTRGVDLLGTGRPLNPGQICTVATACVIPSSLAASVTVPAGTPGVTKNSDGSISITQSTADNINARVPAQYLGLANSRLFAQEQSSSSIYHSLQTSLTHRFSKGLYLQAAYTFAKSIDNASGSSFTDELNGLTGWGDLQSTRLQRGLSDFDRKHRFVVSYNYDLPFAKWLGVQDKGFGKLVNGWAINGIYTAQSGTPFMIFDSSAVTLQDTDFVNTTNFATLAPGATASSVFTSGSTSQRLDNFINLNAFIIGGRCVNNQNVIVSCSDASSTGFSALGNLGRNVFRGPFQTNWDMSFVKTTKITESVNLEFHAEFFDILNHPVFQSPQAAGGSFGNYGQVDIGGGVSSTAILGTANRPRIIQFALKLNF